MLIHPVNTAGVLKECIGKNKKSSIHPVDTPSIFNTLALHTRDKPNWVSINLRTILNRPANWIEKVSSGFVHSDWNMLDCIWEVYWQHYFRCIEGLYLNIVPSVSEHLSFGVLTTCIYNMKKVYWCQNLGCIDMVFLTLQNTYEIFEYTRCELQNPLSIHLDMVYRNNKSVLKTRIETYDLNSSFIIDIQHIVSVHLLFNVLENIYWRGVLTVCVEMLNTHFQHTF